MDLKINYEETRNVGGSVITQSEDFSDLLKTITTINNDLKTVWEGQDASKYANAVEAQAQTMQQLAKKMNEIGNFLVSVGDAYEQTAQQCADAINN